MNENTPELITSECSLIILTFLFLVAKRIQLDTCTFSFQARVVSVRIDQSVIPVPTIINKQRKGSELVLRIAENCAEIVTDSCEMDVNFADNRDSNASIQTFKKSLFRNASRHLNKSIWRVTVVKESIHITFDLRTENTSVK